MYNSSGKNCNEINETGGVPKKVGDLKSLPKSPLISAPLSVLEIALEQADRGWPVIPIFFSSKGGKSELQVPSSKNGGPRWGARSNRRQIEDQWRGKSYPAYGIVCGPDSDLLVIDVDTTEGHEKDGMASLDALEEKYGPLPETPTVRTPSGGLHYYFKYPTGRTVRNGTSVIGNGIDHRGDGGFVVGAGSKRDDGNYTWERTPEAVVIAEAPEWVLDQIADAQTPDELSEAFTGEETNYARTARTAEVQRVAYAQLGSRNHTLNEAAYSLGQLVGGGQLDEARVCRELTDAALECGLERCETLKTINSGIEAGKKEPRLPDNPDKPPFSPFEIAPVGEMDFDQLVGPKHIYSKDFAEGLVTMTVGASKTGKSIQTTVEAVDAATGRGLLDEPIGPPCKVLVFNAEDDENAMRARVAATVIRYGIDQAEYADNLFLLSGIEHGWHLMTGRDGTINEPLFEHFEKLILREGIKLVILDPLQDVITSEETNENISTLFQRLRAMATKCKVAIHIIHHTRKLNGKDDPTVDDSRGASAAVNSARAVRVLATMSDKTAKEFAIDDPYNYQWFSDAKANFTDLSRKRGKYFKKTLVQINENLASPTIECWEPPSPTDGLPDDARKIVLKLIRDAEVDGSPLRQNIQAKEWAGHALGEALGISTQTEAGKAKISRFIKHLLKGGYIQVSRSEPDKKGKDHPVLAIRNAYVAPDGGEDCPEASQ